MGVGGEDGLLEEGRGGGEPDGRVAVEGGHLQRGVGARQQGVRPRG